MHLLVKPAFHLVSFSLQPFQCLQATFHWLWQSAIHVRIQQSDSYSRRKATRLKFKSYITILLQIRLSNFTAHTASLIQMNGAIHKNVYKIILFWPPPRVHFCQTVPHPLQRSTAYCHTSTQCSCHQIPVSIPSQYRQQMLKINLFLFLTQYWVL